MIYGLSLLSLRRHHHLPHLVHYSLFRFPNAFRLPLPFSVNSVSFYRCKGAAAVVPALLRSGHLKSASCPKPRALAPHPFTRRQAPDPRRFTLTRSRRCTRLWSRTRRRSSRPHLCTRVRKRSRRPSGSPTTALRLRSRSPTLSCPLRTVGSAKWCTPSSTLPSASTRTPTWPPLTMAACKKPSKRCRAAFAQWRRQPAPQQEPGPLGSSPQCIAGRAANLSRACLLKCRAGFRCIRTASSARNAASDFEMLATSTSMTSCIARPTPSKWIVRAMEWRQSLCTNNAPGFYFKLCSTRWIFPLVACDGNQMEDRCSSSFLPLWKTNGIRCLFMSLSEVSFPLFRTSN